MIVEYRLRWLVMVLLLVQKVDLQIPMPLYPMGPMFTLPGPQPPTPPVMAAPPLPAMAFQIAMPIPIPIAKPTTTTERNVGVAVPIPLPYPIQIAVPAQPAPDFCLKRPRSPSCPVCPPCLCNPCTPAFFSYCSPCHQKCRCRSASDTPQPMPHVAQISAAGPAYSVGIPSPYLGSSPYVVPIPWTRRDESGENTFVSSSGSSEWSPRQKRSRRKHSRRRSSTRRSMDNVHEINDDEVKPMLSYLSSDGAVKLEKTLSDDEAKDLLDENSVFEGGQRGIDKIKFKSKSKVVSDVGGNTETFVGRANHRHREVYLNAGVGQELLGDGKKKLFFNPPFDKKISNLSVSFQIV